MCVLETVSQHTHTRNNTTTTALAVLDKYTIRVCDVPQSPTITFV